MKFPLSLLPIAYAFDSTSLVNTLLSSLTSQAENAVNTATSSEASTVDSEKLSQEIEDLKAAQQTRSDASTSQNSASAENSSGTSTSALQSEGLQASIKSSLDQMQSLQSSFQNLVQSLNNTSHASSQTNTTSERSGNSGVGGGNEGGFIIKVTMPTHKTNDTANAANKSQGDGHGSGTASSGTEKTAPSIPISLKIYDPISPLSESSLAALKQRLNNDLKNNLNSRFSRAKASDLDHSIDEEIRIATARLASVRDRQKFYQDIADTYYQQLITAGKDELAHSIEQSAAAAAKASFI